MRGALDVDIDGEKHYGRLEIVSFWTGQGEMVDCVGYLAILCSTPTLIYIFCIRSRASSISFSARHELAKP